MCKKESTVFESEANARKYRSGRAQTNNDEE